MNWQQIIKKIDKAEFVIISAGYAIGRNIRVFTVHVRKRKILDYEFSKIVQLSLCFTIVES